MGECLPISETSGFLSASERDTVWHRPKSILCESTKTITIEAMNMALPPAVKATINSF